MGDRQGSMGEDIELDVGQALREPWRFLDRRQSRWLRSRWLGDRVLYRLLYGVNWLAMRALFRLRVEGLEHLPNQGHFILTPNHSSSLDPMALGAALPGSIMRNTWGVGKREAILRNPLLGRLNRIARVLPIDPDKRALAVASAILGRQQNLVWFPEGKRSVTGRLGEFRPGIGLLLHHFRIPAVPCYLDGAWRAWPPSSMIPHRLSRIVVRFGPALWPEQWPIGGSCDEDAEELWRQVDAIVTEVRRRVQRLGPG